MCHASPRTVALYSLTVPRRSQASSSSDAKSAIVAARTRRYSSIRLVSARDSKLLPAMYSFSSKPASAMQRREGVVGASDGGAQHRDSIRRHEMLMREFNQRLQRRLGIAFSSCGHVADAEPNERARIAAAAPRRGRLADRVVVAML